MDDNNITIENATLRYYDEIYQYCRYRISNDTVIKDITQEIFMALCLNCDKINKEKIKKWLYSTAYNKIVDYYRTQKKENEQLFYIDDFENSTVLSCFDISQPDEKELLEYQNKIMNSLSAAEKQLYDDYFIQKIGYSELSKKYNKSEGALRIKISRLKLKITTMIKELLFLCLMIYINMT